ncbi:MAG: HEAT repeat domain-containing protein [Pseudomonadota bacterium]
MEPRDLKQHAIFDEDVMHPLALADARAAYPDHSDDFYEINAARAIERYRQWWDTIQEEGPILDDLRSAGISIPTVFELQHESVAHNEAAVDALLSHMDRDYLDVTYETFIPKIGSANTRKNEVAEALLTRFESGKYHERVSDRIGFTVKPLLNRSHVPHLERIIQNDQLNSRMVLVVPFSKLGREKATKTLIEVIEQPGMLRMTETALGFTRDPAAIPVLARYLDHDESDVRKYARASLKKLEKYRN